MQHSVAPTVANELQRLSKYVQSTPAQTGPTQCVQDPDQCGLESFHLSPNDFTRNPCFNYCMDHNERVLTELLNVPQQAVFQKSSLLGGKSTLQLSVESADIKIQLLTPKRSENQVVELTQVSPETLNETFACFIEHQCSLLPHTELDILVRVRLQNKSRLLLGPQNIPTMPLIGWLWNNINTPATWISNKWRVLNENMVEVRYHIARSVEKSHLPQTIGASIQEIVTSEFNYVSQLYDFCDTFILPLQVQPDVYPNLELTYLLTSTWYPLADLEHEILNELDACTTLAEIVDVFRDYFENPENSILLVSAYTRYFDTQPRIRELIQKLTKKDVNYQNWYAQRGHQTPAGSQQQQSLNFESLYILPTQKLARYTLIFRQNILAKDPHNPDLLKLDNAITNLIREVQLHA